MTPSSACASLSPLISLSHELTLPFSSGLSAVPDECHPAIVKLLTDAMRQLTAASQSYVGHLASDLSESSAPVQPVPVAPKGKKSKKSAEQAIASTTDMHERERLELSTAIFCVSTLAQRCLQHFSSSQRSTEIAPSKGRSKASSSSSALQAIDLLARLLPCAVDFAAAPSNQRCWSPSQLVDFAWFWSRAILTVMESVELLRQAPLRRACLKLLSWSLTTQPTLHTRVSTVLSHLLHQHDATVPVVIAELCASLPQFLSSLLADCFTPMDPQSTGKTLSNTDLTLASRAVSALLLDLSTRCPALLADHLPLLERCLELEPHTLRCGALAALGQLILSLKSGGGSSGEISAPEEKASLIGDVKSEEPPKRVGRRPAKKNRRQIDSDDDEDTDDGSDEQPQQLQANPKKKRSSAAVPQADANRYQIVCQQSLQLVLQHFFDTNGFARSKVCQICVDLLTSVGCRLFFGAEL